jgi:hypothetical protein
LQVGKRLRSPKSACEVIVIRGATSGALMCAGAEMLETGTAPEAFHADGGHAIQLGKRYVDDEAGLEVLCVKAGAGPLIFGGRELTIKAAKSLPASD